MRCRLEDMVDFESDICLYISEGLRQGGVLGRFEILYVDQSAYVAKAGNHKNGHKGFNQ